MIYVYTDRLMAWDQTEPKTGHRIWYIEKVSTENSTLESHSSLQKFSERLGLLKMQGYKMPEDLFSVIAQEFADPESRNNGYKTRVEAGKSRERIK